AEQVSSKARVKAESGNEKVEHTNPWWAEVDKATSLSGNDWWSTFDEAQMESGYVVVDFEVETAGTYTLWLRLDRAGTGYLYSIDGGELKDLNLGEWLEEDRKHRNNINYIRRIWDESFAAHDGSNRHRVVWVRGPEMEWTAGKHTLKIQAKRDEKSNKSWGALDCFVLAGQDFEFRPRMFYKPGEKVETVDEINQVKAWPFPAKRDEFKETPIDLRSMNENVAGEHGFIRLSEDGESFVRGDGEPIRFWSGSDYAWRGPFQDDNLLVSPQEEAEATHHSRWLAKRGINMLRFHGNLFPKTHRRGLQEVTRTTINEGAYHGAWYMVAMNKQHGIYSTISPYWGSHTDNEPGWDLGFKGGNLTGLVFFYEPVQEMYKNYVKRLYTEENPYTGIPLKDDPAVALIQLQNEDSLLFYTAARISGEPLQELTRQFGDFVAKKYGSIEKALENYRSYESGWDMRGKDSVEDGTVGVMQPWFFTQDAGIRANRWDEKTRNRLNDQLEFYTMLMYNFNKDMEAMLREIGCKQLINAGNWKSVDPVTADDAERYSYTANDVMAKNGYYGSLHAGINTGWQILTQQVYTNWSALKRPRFWPTNIKMVDGYPFLVTESLWVPPNLYSAEGALLVASQMSLTGLDSFYWFSSGVGEWSPHDKKWGYTTPMMLGQFPATALAFRKGYIQQAEKPVVYEERSLEDIWQQRTPLISEAEVWDPNRDMGEMPVESKVQTPVDPLAFCTGPVEVKYGGSATNNRVSDQLDELIDTEDKMLKSVTGQITTDYDKGVYMVNAPKFQAAAGFLATYPAIELGDTKIECENEYAAICAVSLDDKNLAESSKILVQVGTKARPDGWKVRHRMVVSNEKEYEGLQILDKGGETLLIENTMASWTIDNDKLNKAVALDENGMPIESDVKLTKNGNTVTVQLPSNALYTIISAE
ncbi:MAG: hypothetical protein ACOC2L_03785, partial [Candidatus Sumerlaeota bacterium]